MFTRTFAAARLDIVLAVLGVAAPLLIGTLMGGILGTTRNALVAGIWLIVIDAINAFPFLAIVIGDCGDGRFGRAVAC